MQQRPINSLCRTLVQDQDYIIEIEQHIQEMKHAPRRMEKRSGYFRRVSIPIMLRDKWIHAIPTAVLLCLFTLWWFSYPVNLEIKDGRIVGIHRADHDTPLTLDTRHVTLAASATSPIAPVPEDLTLSNEIEALPDSNESFRLYENGEEFVRTTYHADHEMPLSLNSNHVALTTTSAISPTAPVPQELRLKDQTEAHSMSNESFSA
ncbi:TRANSMEMBRANE PROTEIN [Salix viminalis]|uniref:TRANSMEMBRANE PROTEIN n=1 Tax=Salix viminalis TaxID=40686 RepID=A0A9Q0SBS5_SALVM|nr:TRANSMEMBRANE PROTEIN [Salix viminalis]